MKLFVHLLDITAQSCWLHDMSVVIGPPLPKGFRYAGGQPIHVFAKNSSQRSQIGRSPAHFTGILTNAIGKAMAKDVNQLRLVRIADRGVRADAFAPSDPGRPS
jgi:hypothetical protein